VLSVTRLVAPQTDQRHVWTGVRVAMPILCRFLLPRSDRLTAGGLDYLFEVRSHIGWLGSRVVSVLDSGAEGPGSNRSRDAVV